MSQIEEILEEMMMNDPSIMAILGIATSKQNSLHAALDQLQQVFDMTNKIMNMDYDAADKIIEEVAKRHARNCKGKDGHETCNVAMRMLPAVLGFLRPITDQHKEAWNDMMKRFSEDAAEATRKAKEERGEIATDFNHNTMALVIEPDGTERAITPLKQQFESFDELYPIIGNDCRVIEVVHLKSNMILLIDEEGKLKGLPINKKATRLYNNHPDTINGTAIYCYRRIIA